MAGLTLYWTDANGTRRRVRLERRSVGGWDRCPGRVVGGRWAPVGREIVEKIKLAVDETTIVDMNDD